MNDVDGDERRLMMGRRGMACHGLACLGRVSLLGDEARAHVEKSQQIIEISGQVGRLSWLSSYCAYRDGYIATKQGRVEGAM